MDSSEVPDLKLLITPPRKRRYKLLVMTALALIVIEGGLLALHHLNSPVTGVVSTGPQLIQKPSTAVVTIYGKTVTFSYSSTLKRMTPDRLAVGDIEKFLFVNPDAHGWTLAIQVRQLPGGALLNDSNYNLRKQNPQQYREEQTAVNGMPVSIMYDQSGTYNKVAFIPHANLVGEIALSGSNNDAPSQHLFNDVLQSWHWL